VAKKDLREFDPERMAAFDAVMWKVYYDHQFGRLLFLLMRLIQLQFGLSHIRSLRVAYYGAVAAADFRVKMGHENRQRVVRRLSKMYRIVSDHAVKPFDYQKAAELELEWWMVHRYPRDYQITLAESLANAMAVVFDVPPSRLMTYAHGRADAMILRDAVEALNGQPPDWQKIEAMLVKSYRSLHKAVQ
jgi:hypothetical protein